MEEVLRYGTKGIYNKFLGTKGGYPVDQAVDLYDDFIRLLSGDESFKDYKMQQLKETVETLSAMEMFAFSLVSSSDDKKEEMHEEMTEELEYDPYNPILYSTDRQIRETLESLLFGEFIHQMVELPGMEPIKARQKESGIIANIDKPFIIGKIQEVALDDKSMAQFKQQIDSRYVKVKMDILLGKGEAAFAPYIGFNTNISSSEILGKEEDYSSDFYEYFMNVLRKRKEEQVTRKEI